MASVTNSAASSKPEYQMVSHVVDISSEPEVLTTSESYIYRVPCNLRKLKEEAYTPLLISIGPLHFGRDHLKPMQQQKLRYFGYFWVRVNDEAAMKGYKEYLAKEEKTIRNRYAEKSPIISEKFPITPEKPPMMENFVEMMLLDAVFIVELFLRIHNKSKYKDDGILEQPWLNKSIRRDLLLLENQVPFFILEELYRIVPNNTDEKHPRFIELAASCFVCFHPYKTSPSPRFNHELAHDHYMCIHPYYSSSSSWLELLLEKRGQKPLHFTDLIRYMYLCEDLTRCEKGSSCYGRMAAMKLIKEVRPRFEECKEGLPCNVLMTATKLKEAGVSFEKVMHGPLLYIKFKKVSILSWFLCLGCISKFTYFKARLQIPQLKVEHKTECVLRNLIAFEQCHYPNKPYICNYVSLIDSLIHTKDDVELLVEKEVIIHDLGSDKEVATLVNGLCKHVVTDQTCYKKIIDELNKHYQSQWNRTMAALRLVYFRDTWRASSTVVGIAVLIFTVFNFYRVVKSVF